MFTGYRIDDDKYIPSLRELALIIQKYNCVAFMQLMGHGANRTGIDFGTIQGLICHVTK